MLKGNEPVNAIEADEADLTPTRLADLDPGRPAEPIPAAVNEVFLADLATERALSMARKLASAATSLTEPLAGGLQPLGGRIPPSEPATPVLSQF
jgi:hypothetical protein